MKNRPVITDILWMGAGAAVLAVIFLGAWHFQESADPARLLAAKASRADLVERMQLAIASASEAEKSAVLATTDEDSRTFADQARATAADVDRERQQLAGLLAEGGIAHEQDLLARFSETFENLRHIDDEVLRLAVENTNLKAFALLFGPAADALAEMDAALSRLLARHADPSDARRVMPLAFGARLGVLRIQGLLAPHVAEESDAKMDRLEAAMADEETRVRKDLDELAALPSFRGDADLAAATSSFVQYGGFKTRILALSRENTNVRSLALSLNQKRKAMVVCLDALDALRQAILDEPIRGVTYGRPVSPR